MNPHPSLPSNVAQDLRNALASVNSERALTDDLRRTIAMVCSLAKENTWTPEQLVVAVKEACYSSMDFARHSSSEREAIVARVVTGCIREFYRAQPN